MTSTALVRDGALIVRLVIKRAGRVTDKNIVNEAVLRVIGIKVTSIVHIAGKTNQRTRIDVIVHVTGETNQRTEIDVIVHVT